MYKHVYFVDFYLFGDAWMENKEITTSIHPQMSECLKFEEKNKWK